jgi:hypothetical protein
VAGGGEEGGGEGRLGGGREEVGLGEAAEEVETAVERRHGLSLASSDLVERRRRQSNQGKQKETLPPIPFIASFWA